MARRTNPWPAFVELFSALLTATFAGFIMLSGAYQQEVAGYQLREVEMKKVRAEADSIIEKVKKSLDEDDVMKNIVRSCGDDTCIDLYIHFESNREAVANSDESQALSRTCNILKGALDGLPAGQRKDMEFIIEGHTDNRQISGPSDQRTRDLFNWNLSAQRAASVLYEFQQCGLRAPEYQIIAIGYADSAPLCRDETAECYAKNRRTTLRLRADTKRIEERFKSANADASATPQSDAAPSGR